MIKALLIKLVIALMFDFLDTHWEAALKKVKELAKLDAQDLDRARKFNAWFVQKFGADWKEVEIDTLRNLAVRFSKDK